MPQDGSSNQYGIAKSMRDRAAAAKDSASADPHVKGLPYGSKPIIKGVPQARGTYDRNIVDPFVPGSVKKPAAVETKT